MKKLEKVFQAIDETGNGILVEIDASLGRRRSTKAYRLQLGCHDLLSDGAVGLHVFFRRQ